MSGGAPPLHVICDTREQEPWDFTAAVPPVAVTRATLGAGDYSLAGHEHEVAVERKSLDDYVQTIIHDRERYMRELERLRTYRLAAVVVEASWQDVVDHNYTSRATPASVFGMTCCFIVDYGVPVYLIGNRALAARFALRLLRRYAQNQAAQQEATEP